MSATNTPVAAGPDTIVLVHGLWMTPRSWEHWIAYYSDRGYQVLVPGYPGFEVEVEALRADPVFIADLTVPTVLEHLESVIGGVERPPIIIGHSFGGVLVQILLDRGYGAAGVAINSVPAENVTLTPPSQIKALFPALRNPANRNKLAQFTPAEFHYAFTNTLSDEESAKVYERYYIPAPGRFVWDGALAKLAPGRQQTYVNFRNDDRSPLLFIAGGKDNIMPASVNESNARHYSHSRAVTDYYVFPERTHYTVGENGWEAVADYALDWAVRHAKPAPAKVSATA